jgi:hypothetical protein
MRTIPSGVFEFGKLPSCPAVRGVVVGGPYFADDQAEREAAARQRDPNFYQVTTVAADVLTYGARFRAFLAKVPIVPQRHALNDYTGLWIPRAASKDLRTGTGPILSRDDGTPSDPKDLDGDHVLVEFLENDTTMPFIRSELPHPRTNYRQLHAAGDAVESRFRGVVTRIDKDGNVTVDTTKANSGAIDSNGAEMPALDANHGTVMVRMNHNAPFVLEGLDADGGNEKFKLEIDPAAKVFRVRLDNGLSLEITDKDGAAILQLGDGIVNAAIFQNLEAWWNGTAWPAIQASFDAHVHPSAMGPTGPPVPLFGLVTGTAGTLAADVKANKVKITDG